MQSRFLNVFFCAPPAAQVLAKKQIDGLAEVSPQVTLIPLKLLADAVYVLPSETISVTAVGRSTLVRSDALNHPWAKERVTLGDQVGVLVPAAAVMGFAVEDQ